MIVNKNVKSNEKPKIVDKNISSKYVYVRDNIKEEVDSEGNKSYTYDEILYDKEIYKGIEAFDSNKEQDLAIMEQDFIIMELKANLPTPITYSTATPNSSSYKLLKRMILSENYNSKEEMISNIEKYCCNNRITENEKNELIELLG